MDNKKYTPLFVKKFVYYFLQLRNIREAAIKAGCEKENADFDGMEILKRKSVRSKIKNYDEKLSDDTLCLAGLKRLATGSTNDAVKLIFSDDLPSGKFIDNLDLFNVSEIKRDKNGGVEIKFFDRQKALEKIFEIKNTSGTQSNAESFLKALCDGYQSQGTEELKTDDTI